MNTVYKISNIINNKIYFGVTQQDLKVRWQQHKCNSNKKSYHLYNAIKKYGFDNFYIEIVFEAQTKKEMLDKEIELISMYNTNNRLYGYNNSTGGESSRKGCKLTQEQKNNISEYQKNRIRKSHSIETIKKMSLVAKGRDMTKVIEKSVKVRKGIQSHNVCKVYKYSLDGVFIEKFDSYTLAAKNVGGVVCAFGALKKDRLKTYKNFIWKFEN